MVLDPQGYPLQQYTNLADTVVYEILSDGTLVLINGCTISMGNGSPEGVKTAPIGSWYIRTDGVAPNIWYQKQTGTGNTGWVAVGSGSVANPAAPDTAIQFNNGGAFGGSANLTWNGGLSAFKEIGVANFTDAASVASIAVGKINGFTMAAFDQNTVVEPAGGASAFDAAATLTDPVTAPQTIFSTGVLVSPSADSVADYLAFLNTAFVPSTSTHAINGALNGGTTAAVNAGSGNINFMSALQNFAIHNGSGNIHNSAAIDGEAGVFGGGTMDIQIGIFALAGGSSGHVTDNYGIFLEADNNSGATFDHTYGLWVSDFTPGISNPDSWAIWTNGGPHHFGGKVTATGIYNSPALQVFANNAAALGGGLVVGDFYRNGADPDHVCVVH